jgi:hypothetical protein
MHHVTGKVLKVKEELDIITQTGGNKGLNILTYLLHGTQSFVRS